MQGKMASYADECKGAPTDGRICMAAAGNYYELDYPRWDRTATEQPLERASAERRCAGISNPHDDESAGIMFANARALRRFVSATDDESLRSASLRHR